MSLSSEVSPWSAAIVSIKLSTDALREDEDVELELEVALLSACCSTLTFVLAVEDFIFSIS